MIDLFQFPFYVYGRDVSIHVSGQAFCESFVTVRLPRWPGRLLLANGNYVEDLLLNNPVALEPGLTILMEPNPESEGSELVHLGVGSIRDVVLQQWGSDRDVADDYMGVDLPGDSNECLPVAWPQGSRIGFVRFAPGLRSAAHVTHAHVFLHHLLQRVHPRTVASAEPELIRVSEQDTQRMRFFCGCLLYLLDLDQVALHCPALDGTGATERLWLSGLQDR